MSLNSVVNNLVRAAAGISNNISDNDLDAHVAKLLAEEAKARELKWSELGLTGLLGTSLNRNESTDNLPKTNKRFLASVIRNVDGHNSALLKSQAQSAYEIRSERGESSSRKQVGNRLFGGALRDVGRNTNNVKGKERERERIQDADSNSRRREDDRVKPRSERYEDDVDYSRNDVDPDHHRSRDRGRSSDQDRFRDRSRDRTRDRSRDRDDPVPGRNSRRHDSERSDNISRNYDKRSRSPSRSLKRSESPKPTKESAKLPSPSPTASRSSAPPLAPPLSKMDKYFSTTYDPRLDFASIPKQGLIEDVGWDNMLAILKEKGKKRRHQSPSLLDDISAPPKGVLPSKRQLDEYEIERKLKKKEKKERKLRQGWDSEDEERERKRKSKKKKEKEEDEKYLNLKKEGGLNKSTSGLLDGYNYVKKGGTREWDAGK
ncbi:uncharacterized protein I206_106012 [Kwoniella pini CBS 10737]|uniref:Uncharacterized protein n=1 Tax=Kwoniella pini CBS 10737 TaxID=1296096 RepID=A0A1B9I0U6_9TREE|nr:uncharacterized protein I206_04835 [Kwoniella pini CBS 10737]OCF49147.1 hypothetical protein I206_04835 [Kwoniella pini CBS 10737]